LNYFLGDQFASQGIAGLAVPAFFAGSFGAGLVGGLLSLGKSR
jgi:hypothetical protein